MAVKATNVNELKPHARPRVKSLMPSTPQVSVVFPKQWPGFV